MMLKKSSVLLILACLLTNCHQNESKTAQNTHLVPDSVAYVLISQVIYSDTTNNKEFVNNTLFAELLFPSLTNSDSLMIASQDSIFSEEDKKFIIEQIDQKDSLYLKKEMVPGIQLISFDSVSKWRKNGNAQFWTSYHKHYSKGFRILGFPLFSVDLNKAIILESAACGGLCGWSAVRIYIRQGTKWVQFKTLKYAVS